MVGSRRHEVAIQGSNYFGVARCFVLLWVKEQQLQLSLWQYHDLRYFVVIQSVLMDLLTSSTTIK